MPFLAPTFARLPPLDCLLADQMEPRKTAYFSDRGRWFQRDRGRCFKMIVDDHGSTRVKGFMVSQSSTITVKRRSLSMPASIAGVVNAAPKAMRICLSTA